MATKNIDIIIQAKDLASRSIKNVQGSLEGIGETVKTASKYIAGLTVGVVAFGLKSAGQLQQTRVAFENLYGSAEKAGDTIKKLTEFSAKTPFEMPEVADMALKLKNVAGITDDNLIPSLTRLGDIASSQGKSLSQSVEAFLDATTGEFERLKEFGIKAAQSGDQVSFTFRGQTETIAKTSEAIGGYLAKIGQMEGIAGGMEKQSQTLNGVFSTFKDTVSGLTRNLVGLSDTGEVVKGGLLDKVTVGLAYLNKTIEENKEKIKAFGEGVGKVIEILLSKIAELTTNLILIYKAISKWVELRPVFSGVVLGITGIEAALLLINANPIMALITAGLLLIANWESIKLNVGGAIYLMLEDIKNYFGQMKDFIIQIGSDIKWGFLGFIDGLYDGLVAKVDAALAYVKKKVQQAKELMSSIGGAIATSVTNVGANVKTVLGVDGTRAVGGPVSSGGNYLVGEKGPELFVPKQSGTIIPNGGFGGGGNTININMGGVSVTNQADENRLVEKIKKALINDAKLYNIGIS